MHTSVLLDTSKEIRGCSKLVSLIRNQKADWVSEANPIEVLLLFLFLLHFYIGSIYFYLVGCSLTVANRNDTCIDVSRLTHPPFLMLSLGNIFIFKLLELCPWFPPLQILDLFAYKNGDKVCRMSFECLNLQPSKVSELP